MILRAYGLIEERRRSALQLLELPVARVAHIVAQTQGADIQFKDLLFFESNEPDKDAFPADAALVCLALREEKQLPPPLVGVWPHILKAAEQKAKMPSWRWLESEEGDVWILAPRWEQRNLRGLLVILGRGIAGQSRTFRDPDRPLWTPVTLQLPPKLPNARSYVEAEALLVAT